MFEATDQFDIGAMQEFMRRPDIFWASADALSPQPEQIDFTGHLLHPDVWTVAAMFQGHIVGYVQFNKRTSVGAEIHVGFHPQFRGVVAKTFIGLSIQKAFEQKGILKLWAIIAADNRRAIWGAKALGFKMEGRLTKAIVRQVEGGPPLIDLLILGLNKETWQ